MMDFEIDAAGEAVRKLLAQELDNPLRHWDRVMKQYRSAKAELIAALNPTTARVTAPLAYELTPAEQCRLLCNSLPDTIRPDLLRENDIPNVGPTSDMRLVHKVFVPGRKLSRCLAEWAVSQCGYSLDDASAKVARWFDRIRPRKGTVVLSCNPWDLLTCSEYCAYSSCHSFDGQYRAGPQEYLADGTTCVAYYWDKVRTVNGVAVPYKIARQIVHIGRQSAYFMREYGDPPPGFYAAVKTLVAGVIRRLPRGVTTFHIGGGCAYIDPIERRVGPAGPRWTSARQAPCPACRSGHLESGGSLACCMDGMQCCECHCTVNEDDWCREDDSIYCNECHDDAYSHCEQCSENYPCDDVSTVGNRSVCDGCRDHCCTRCTMCDEWYYTSGRGAASMYSVGDDAVCETCFDRHCMICDTCDEGYHRNDVDVYDGGIECLDCKQKRLTQRLHASPAWQNGGEVTRWLLNHQLEVCNGF